MNRSDYVVYALTGGDIAHRPSCRLTSDQWSIACALARRAGSHLDTSLDAKGARAASVALTEGLAKAGGSTSPVIHSPKYQGHALIRADLPAPFSVGTGPISKQDRLAVESLAALLLQGSRHAGVVVEQAIAKEKPEESGFVWVRAVAGSGPDFEEGQFAAPPAHRLTSAEFSRVSSYVDFGDGLDKAKTAKAARAISTAIDRKSGRDDVDAGLAKLVEFLCEAGKAGVTVQQPKAGAAAA